MPKFMPILRRWRILGIRARTSPGTEGQPRPARSDARCEAIRGSVGGNVQVNNNSSGTNFVQSNTIAGNVQVNNNSGGSSDVSANNIGGNLNCAGNTGVTDPRGANTVAGKKQGQCAGL